MKVVSGNNNEDNKWMTGVSGNRKNKSEHRARNNQCAYCFKIIQGTKCIRDKDLRSEISILTTSSYHYSF